MIIRVTDYQERRPSDVQARAVFLNTDYIVAMEPWGAKYKVFVGRSLEYVVSSEDAQRLGEGRRRSALSREAPVTRSWPHVQVPAARVVDFCVR